MEDNNQLKRREFLKTGATLAAAAFLVGTGSTNLFSAIHGPRTIPTFTLNNGLKMPVLGFGTNTLNGPECVRCVSEAISAGYRLIDTATIYGNEQPVGEGIKSSGISRGELFITSKLWVDDSGYGNTMKAFETTLTKLGTDYLDLYLIHRPRGDVRGTWKAMEDLNRLGRIKAIGVSNFSPAQLDELMAYGTIRPTVNQIETHVFFQQHDSYNYLKSKGVQMEAWSPFAAGRNNIFTNTTLAGIARKHNTGIAQVCLRWHYQRGIVAIPRSRQVAHIMQNLDIWNFELDQSDLQTIASLDLNTTQFPEWE